MNWLFILYYIVVWGQLMTFTWFLHSKTSKWISNRLFCTLVLSLAEKCSVFMDVSVSHWRLGSKSVCKSSLVYKKILSEMKWTDGRCFTSSAGTSLKIKFIHAVLLESRGAYAATVFFHNQALHNILYCSVSRSGLSR